eukprot:COSAG02_NODE_2275_length_9246_cov_50.124194_5_plen_87_part_00
MIIRNPIHVIRNRTIENHRPRRRRCAVPVLGTRPPFRFVRPYLVRLFIADLLVLLPHLALLLQTDPARRGRAGRRTAGGRVGYVEP